MQHTTTHIPAPPVARPSTGGARAVPITIGAVIAVIASVVALAGGGILWVFGSDGTAATGPHTVTSSTSALVSETATLTDSADVAKVLGSTRIEVSADATQAGHGVFVGIGRTADVDRYLQGAAIDKVTDFDVDPFTLDRTRRDGSATPGAPAEQSFWVAKSSGSESAAIDWKTRDGDYRVVIMNADGSRGVTADSTFGVEIPGIPDIAWVLLIIGAVGIAGGLTLIVVGVRPRKGPASS
jgi:hypothetical protein